MFALLPAPALEGLARSLEPVDVPAGETVIRQGEPGDRFYAIADGSLAVEVDGRRVGEMSRPDGFGEIALLRDVPRTATVRALSPARLYALPKAAFLSAVTGTAEAETLADQRLARAAPAIQPLR